MDPDEGVAGDVLGRRDNLKAVAVTLGAPQQVVGRKQELLPGLLADPVAEEGLVVPRLQTEGAGFRRQRSSPRAGRPPRSGRRR